MMKNIIDMTGEKYGHWTVLGFSHTKKGAWWKCQCVCGAIKTIQRRHLRNKHTTSCGCKRGKHRHTKIGGWCSPTYSSWKNMRARCTQPSCPAFKHYKKHGITVCKRWKEFTSFLEDMGERPEGNYTLDRWPDNSGNYEPGNVRWATKRQQANNRSTNIHFKYRGKEYTLAELARATGVEKELLRSRLCRSKKPWTVEGAVSSPAKTKGKKSFYA